MQAEALVPQPAYGYHTILTETLACFLPGGAKNLYGYHTILTETLACFLPGVAKNLSAPLYLKPGE